jgi:hypothetical protein
MRVMIVIIKMLIVTNVVTVTHNAVTINDENCDGYDNNDSRSL